MTGTDCLTIAAFGGCRPYSVSLRHRVAAVRLPNSIEFVQRGGTNAVLRFTVLGDVAAESYQSMGVFCAWESGRQRPNAPSLDLGMYS